MSPQIRLSRQQLADLKTIREIGRVALREVLTALQGLPPLPVRPGELHATISKGLRGQKHQADALVRQALALHGMVRQLPLTSEDVFEGILRGVQAADKPWSEAEIKEWQALGPDFQAIFDLEVVQLSAKALDLSYEHAELLQRARIVTDIRPVFNREATEIRSSVVSHSLLLRYDDSEGNHVLSLALDENDIELLIRQCERALTKAGTIRARLDAAKIPTLHPDDDQ